MGFFDKVKSVIGVDDEYYDDDYTDDGYGNEYNHDYASNPAEEGEGDKEAPSYGSGYSSGYSSASNVVNMSSSASRTKISIQEPLEYEDGASVIDRISEAKTVVLNLEMLEPEKKRQIFDFVSGGVYALDGQIQKVTKDIYVLTPKGIQVDSNKAKDSVNTGSLYQL